MIFLPGLIILEAAILLLEKFDKKLRNHLYATKQVVFSSKYQEMVDEK
jgi:hypothetical protein